jgi:hypothetical protein
MTVVSGSSLSRRRGWGAHVLVASRYGIGPGWILCIVGSIALAALVIAWDKPSRIRSQDKAVPLTGATASHGFDRYNITYGVVPGDTIWGLSKRYYDSASQANQDKLRTANPWLPDDLRHLSVGSPIQVPLP